MYNSIHLIISESTGGLLTEAICRLKFVVLSNRKYIEINGKDAF